MTIDAGEYKSAVGLRDVYIAEVTEDSLANYTAGTPEYFAPAVTASQEAAVNSKTQYADDGAFDALSSEGETKLSLEVTNIPLSVLGKIAGAQFDAATGQLYDNAGTAPYYAVGFKSKKSNGKYRFFWFLKGRFSKPSEEMGTETDTPDPKTVKIVFTAIKTVHPFDLGTVNDGVKRVIGDEDLAAFTGESTWFDDVVTPPEVESSGS